MADYDSTGVRATMLRGGTSRGLYFEPADLPTDPEARDDLLLRLMGTPDPRQIDGLGGATTLTSKIAVVGPSDHPEADVDYLFLQLGVDEATVSDQQNCGIILAGVGPFAVERGLVPAGSPDTDVRIRMVNSDSIA
ncbi:MAG: 4-oxalomesaconate tautomerase, partial [Pseudonocardiales bacterium]|nr:4-oxalomesaconate tautomerase [Pseudonocardiales bacterium]